MSFTAEQVAQLLRQTAIKPSGCVEWVGARNPQGYGVIKIGGRSGRTFLVHRMAYELWFGDIDPGMQIDHTCHSKDCLGGAGDAHRRCLAPAHLEQVTGRTNTRRSHAGRNLVSSARAKTHCPQGHPYDETNTYVSKTGTRSCRECARARFRRLYAEGRYHR